MYVQMSDITFKYRNAKTPVIHEFSYDIAHGEIVSVYGPSGCGKSTLLRLIAGLEQPHAGSLVIDGRELVSPRTFVQPEHRGIGMVFQDYALFPHLTVEQNVRYGLRGRSDGKERVNAMLELVRMVEFRHRYPHQLSGGQQQRVAIARALAPAPSVLLLDEPFSNLDDSLHTVIRAELKEIIRAAGMTSIFVTHDYEDTRVIADKVIKLESGRISDFRIKP